MHADEEKRLLQVEIDRLTAELATTRRAGQELATALWALVLAQESSMAGGLEAALEHATEVAKRYTAEKDRAQLTAALERAQAGAGSRVLRA